jgi:hypothetical protein
MIDCAENAIFDFVHVVDTSFNVHKHDKINLGSFTEHTYSKPDPNDPLAPWLSRANKIKQ